MVYIGQTIQSNGNEKTRSPFVFKIRAGEQSAPMGIK